MACFAMAGAAVEKWRCDTCCLQWDMSLIKCKACESFRPGMSQDDIDAANAEEERKQQEAIAKFTGSSSTTKPTGFLLPAPAASSSFSFGFGSAGAGAGAPATATFVFGASPGGSSGSSSTPFGFAAPGGDAGGCSAAATAPAPAFAFGFGASAAPAPVVFGTGATPGAAPAVPISFGFKAADVMPAAGAAARAPAKLKELAAAPNFGAEGRAPVGDVFVHGSGECDQLGLGDAQRERQKPTIIKSLSDKQICDLAVGALHAICLSVDGRLFSWGCNDDGALGRAAGDSDCEPRLVDLAREVVVRSISCGDNHSAALDSVGRVWLWGTYKDSNGHIGIAQKRKQAGEVLEKSAAPALVLEGCCQIASGANHTLALARKPAAKVFAWGSNSTGQLGLQGGQGCGYAEEIVPAASGLDSKLQSREGGGTKLDGRHVVRCREASGVERSIADASPDRVAGMLRSGAAALIVELPEREVPKKEKQGMLLPQEVYLGDLESGSITGVFASAECTFVALAGQPPRGCGLNGDGQVGLGFPSMVVQTLKPILGVAGASWLGGGLHNTAALVGSTVFAWGKADECGLGLGDKSSPVMEPRAIGGLPPIRRVRCGGHHTLACSEAGDVFAWGCGLTHQLANRPRDVSTPDDKDDDPEDELRPYLVSSKQLERRFVMLADGGAQHSAELAWNGGYAELVAAPGHSAGTGVASTQPAEEGADEPPPKRLQLGDGVAKKVLATVAESTASKEEEPPAGAEVLPAAGKGDPAPEPGGPASGSFAFGAPVGSQSSGGGFALGAAAGSQSLGGASACGASPSSQGSGGGFIFGAAPSSESAGGGVAFGEAPSSQSSGGGLAFGATSGSQSSGGGGGFAFGAVSGSSGGGFAFGVAPGSDPGSGGGGGFAFGAAPGSQGAGSGGATGGFTFGVASSSGSCGGGALFPSFAQVSGAASLFGAPGPTGAASGGSLFGAASAGFQPQLPATTRKRPAAPDFSRDGELPTGQVFVHGSGECDQLGLGDVQRERQKPTLVKGLSEVSIRDIAVGALHVLCVSAEGRLFSWGCNDDGALGRASNAGLDCAPASVGLPGDVQVARVSCGDNHSAALDSAGSVWLWGTYKDGNGHIGILQSRSLDAVVEKSVEPAIVLEGCTRIASGFNHTLALSQAGKVFAWGSNATGQLGLPGGAGCGFGEEVVGLGGTTVAVQSREGGGAEVNGRRVARIRDQLGVERSASGMPAAAVQAAAAGAAALVLEVPEREVPKKEKQALLLPQEVPLSGNGRSGGSDVFASAECTFVVMRDDGAALGCGLNGDGQVGLGFPSMAVLTLQPVPCLKGASWIGGGLHMSAALIDGKVFTWGKSDECGLGLNAGAPPVMAPREVATLPRIRALRCGGHHTLACSEDGDVFAWGCGLTHQLGNRPRDFERPQDAQDEPEDELRPYRVSSKQLEARFVLLADGGAQHSVELAWTGGYTPAVQAVASQPPSEVSVEAAPAAASKAVASQPPSELPAEAAPAALAEASTAELPVALASNTLPSAVAAAPVPAATPVPAVSSEPSAPVAPGLAEAASSPPEVPAALEPATKGVRASGVDAASPAAAAPALPPQLVARRPAKRRRTGTPSMRAWAEMNAAASAEAEVLSFFGIGLLGEAVAGQAAAGKGCAGEGEGEAESGGGGGDASAAAAPPAGVGADGVRPSRVLWSSWRTAAGEATASAEAQAEEATLAGSLPGAPSPRRLASTDGVAGAVRVGARLACLSRGQLEELLLAAARRDEGLLASTGPLGGPA